MSLMKTLVVGSSHINRFKRYLTTHHLECLNIANIASVTCVGVSGGRIDNKGHIDVILRAIRTVRPNVVIVQIGGNDLDICNDHEDVERMVLHLVTLCTLFLREISVQHVYVNQFLPRSSPRHTEAHTYNARVIMANQFLKRELEDQVALQYWKMKGFVNTEQILFADGVHLNDRGLLRYYRHIRGAVLQFLRRH